MSGKPNKINTMYALRSRAFADGYYGRDPERPRNPFYMTAYQEGERESHRQNSEEEAYALECHIQGVEKLSLEKSVAFSIKFHETYDLLYGEGPK